MIIFSGEKICIGGKWLELEHPVPDAFELEGHVIVLSTTTLYAEKFGQFPNLVALRPTARGLPVEF